MKKILIVLDFNGTLLYRLKREYKLLYSILQNRPIEDFVLSQQTKAFKRPKVDEFLSRLDKNFSVATWTSSQAKNANVMIKHLFTPEMQDRLVFNWDRQKCVIDSPRMRPLNTFPQLRELVQLENNDELTDCFEEYCKRENGKPLARKNLSKIWDEMPEWTPMNTVLIDDSAEKALSDPYNCIHIPSFDLLNPQCDSTDNHLSKVADFLEAFDGSDIREYVRNSEWATKLK